VFLSFVFCVSFLFCVFLCSFIDYVFLCFLSVCWCIYLVPLWFIVVDCL